MATPAVAPLRNPTDGESRRRGFGNLLRPVVIVPVVLVVFGAAVWFGVQSAHGSSNGSNATTTQQLYTVSPTTMRETISTSGAIAAASTNDLSFTVAGTVTAVNVKAGQAVKKGQVLATISSADLQSQVAQAEASLTSAQAQLASDESSGASSAQISLDNANVASAYATLATANQNLSGASLTSPVDGVVSTVNLTVGQVLNSSGSSATNLTGSATGSGRNNNASSNSSGNGDNSSSNSSSAQVEVISNALVVNLGVDTTQIGNVKVGDTAEITPSSSSGNSGSNAGGGRFFFGGGGGFTGGFGGAGGAGGTGRTGTGGNGGNGNATNGQSTATGAAAPGTVTSVGAIATSSSGVATFPVVVTVTGAPSGFHAGANASVVITYHELQNVLAVPTTALHRSNGTTTVTVSNNGHTSEQTVTTGLVTAGQVQITSGLQSGDQVVVTVPALRRANTGTNGNNTNRTGFFGGGGGGGFGGFGGAGGGAVGGKGG